jgi:4-diphosphocytidyl-2-C-methyl-D-erythritol kinase
LILNSCAKLNLYLAVLNKGKDGYHNIESIFERIDLSDKIILKPRRDNKIKIVCSSPLVPKGKSNLAFRSAKILQDNFCVKKGINIEIIKHIPVGAGLGGGSSNAATVLLGLNKLWRLNLTQNKLVGLAGSIGSDIPFFIYNTPFARGTDRGNRIKPLKGLSNLKIWHVLVVPKIEVSTPFIYKKWDMYSGLTRPGYSAKLLISALRKSDFSLISKSLFNSLERITAGLYPEVVRIKERLMSLGLKSILMSGSGPAVFAIVSSRKEAVSLCRQLKEENRFWQVFVSQTI